MRKVVITGFGIVSSLGNDTLEVESSLKSFKSGITLNETNKEMGLRSHISGSIKHLNLKYLIQLGK